MRPGVGARVRASSFRKCPFAGFGGLRRANVGAPWEWEIPAKWSTPVCDQCEECRWRACTGACIEMMTRRVK